MKQAGICSGVLLRFGVCLLALGCTSCARYACGVPEGGRCSPLSAVYQAILDGFAAAPALPERADAGPREDTAHHTPNPGAEGEPRLTRPRQLYVWIPPWIDAEGDLHGESYLYLRLDEGRWILSP